MAFGQSAAVLAALKRRAGGLTAGSGALTGKGAGKKLVRIQWFIDEVSNKVAFTMKARVRIATEFVKSKVVKNISRPVTKSGGRVSDRSKEGEFPKAETTQLLKTIFGETRTSAKGIYDGFVGTPLDYGLILETRRDRSFLVRTLNEERATVKAILSGPIR